MPRSDRPSSGTHPPHRDVRMRGFASRSTLAEALAWLDAQLLEPRATEQVPLHAAAGRVLAENITSTIDVPGFNRSMMDGFAVRGADTQGAGPYNALPLKVIGQSLPGRPFAGSVERCEAVRIMTGAPLPQGADAVLPAEQANCAAEQVTAIGEVPPGKHVGRRGEDVVAGAALLSAGRRLRPQDLGLLSSIGHGRVSVVQRPRVRIVVTGDELLPAGSQPSGHRIADANGPMLAALVERDGGLPLVSAIVPDAPEALLAAMRPGATEPPADVVLVSGGSSVGQEDHAPVLLAQHGELAIHGIAMRPSSPTGMGRLESALVFLLPGNPVSCLCAYDFFAGRAIRALGGRSADWPYRRTTAALARKLNSQVGRVDYARVRWIDGRIEPLAIGGASILSSTSRADGFVIVPGDSEGYPAGATVEMYLYE